MEDVSTQADYQAVQHSWLSRVPWHRRTSASLGIQGKLVVCFMAVLAIALISSCWMFISQSKAQLADLMGEQARQIAYSLSLAGKPAILNRQYAELNRIGQDLLKSRNVLFVAFFNDAARPLSFASRDPDCQWTQLTTARHNTQSLMQVRRRGSPVFGDYLEVTAPILSLATIQAAAGAETQNGGLLGYVTVGLSPAREQAQLRRINIFVVGIGCLIGIVSLPLAYLLVHRVFLPIRQLVTATNRIAAGDLDTQVAIHRPDVIGTLARSFNEMVQRVKHQQQLLAAANRDLEQKVMQRTTQLETANTRLSSEIAEKEDFLRAVSHDLNAPLRNISGMAAMLMMKYRDKLDGDLVHRLERIQKNVQVETDLIGELLELSRIKTRRHKMEMVEIDALVRDLGDVFENDLRSKGIQLLIDNPLPVLCCERSRLRQVFQNLIDNAIKYMGEGPVREIHIGYSLRAAEAEFYVRDTGLGIDPEDMNKVFRVFRRGKNGQAHNIAGKGVGLASVKSIIETYSGTIWVESGLGQGSTFHFTINGQHVPAIAAVPARPTAGPEDSIVGVPAIAS